MAALVLAVNPIIATIGQIAAIIICLFIFIFVLLAVAFNLGIAFGMGWVREKVNLIKMLRPVVESVNKASESAVQGGNPADNESSIVRTIATVPAQLHNIDKKVEQTTDRIANVAIEVRARAEQGKAIVQAFLRPRTSRRAISASVDGKGLESKRPGYRALTQEQAPVMPVASEHNGYRRDVSQVK
jgi:hypothetical protein